MKISLVALHFSEYASRLGVALAQAGHRVQLVAMRENFAREVDAHLEARVRGTLVLELIDGYPLRDPRFLSSSWKLYRSVARFGADVLHLQENPRDFAFLPFHLLSGRMPTTLTVHDPVPHSGHDSTFTSWRSRNYRFGVYVNHIRRRAHQLIVHGTSLRDDLARIMPPGTAERINVLPLGALGVDVSDIDATPASGPRQGGPLRTLFFGRIEAYKGLGTLLDAVDLLAREGLDLETIVAGTGRDLDRHRDRMAAMPGVRLVENFIPSGELASVFGDADVVVLPYTDATQSAVATVAFAFGVPVIATRTGSLPEMVRDGENGLLVPPRDARAFADAMRALAVDPQLRQRLAAGAHRSARNELSWPQISRQTLDVYRKAMARRAAAA